jgi:hypothetical protein
MEGYFMQDSSGKVSRCQGGAMPVEEDADPRPVAVFRPRYYPRQQKAR